MHVMHSIDRVQQCRPSIRQVFSRYTPKTSSEQTDEPSLFVAESGLEVRYNTTLSKTSDIAYVSEKEAGPSNVHSPSLPNHI